jgi:hypothetical protein
MVRLALAAVSTTVTGSNLSPGRNDISAVFIFLAAETSSEMTSEDDLAEEDQY